MGRLDDASPAWQTDELAEEWIEEEGEAEEAAGHERHASEEQQLAPTVHGIFNDRGSLDFATADVNAPTPGPEVEQTTQIGTFVVHSDKPSAQLPQTPALGKKKGPIKDIFSPLQLERLFEPPSPPKASPASTPTPRQRTASTSQHHISSRPARPSKLSQVIGTSTLGDESDHDRGNEPQEVVKTDVPNVVTFGQTVRTPTCRFTFSVPRSTQRFPARINFASPSAATSTPNDNSVCIRAQRTPFPATPFPARTPRANDQQLNPNESRIRLFQFQYDSYTREHLSAIVDSFGVSSPSNVSNSQQSASTVVHRPPAIEELDEDRADPETFSRLRAAKRVKLTPPSEFTPEATEQFPQQRRDYVGEARSFMQKIRRARGLSLMSTADTQEQEPAHARALVDCTNKRLQECGPSNVPSEAPSSPTANTRFSHVGFRQKAEDLMAKIKDDPDLTSGRGDTSFISQKSDDHRVEKHERSSAPSPEVKQRLPVKKHLEGKENEILELEPEPPSYAASIALNRGQFENQLVFKNHPQVSENPTSHKIVIMPVSIPEDVPPVIADCIRSPNPALFPPPTALGSLRFMQAHSASTTEDLARLVSTGSSATTGTTLTIGSIGSGIKHAGQGMVRIAPGDLPSIPERVNGMVFDRKLGRWIKERGSSDKTAVGSSRRSSQGSVGPLEGLSESEDPFRDIESLPDEHAGRAHLAQDLPSPTSPSVDCTLDGSDGTEDMQVVSSDSDSEFDDDEDTQISPFAFDRHSTGVVKAMTGDPDDLSEVDVDDDTTDSEDHSEQGDGEHDPKERVDQGLYDNIASMSLQDEEQPEEGASTALAAAVRDNMARNQKNFPQSAATPCKTHRRHMQPPRSALKSASVTPISKGRSVSFSDGRKDGKIIGLHPSHDRTTGVPTSTSALAVPSARSRRIMDMLEDADESLLDDDDQNSAHEYMQADTMPPVPVDTQREASFDAPSPRTLSRSRSTRLPGQSSPRRVDMSSRTNATFLTECSFGVAHDRLVEVITDAQPFEPHWESLTSIDLSRQRLDSVARLKEFLPQLDVLNLNNNLLSWLSGIPTSVRTLSVANNALTSLTSFGRLKNLENLDISYNDIDSLQQLKCLRHLRELRADGNKIEKLAGLEDFDGLLKLSLEGNQLHEVDLSGFRWSRLELLNLSNNHLTSVQGLDSAPALVTLNLDNNLLSVLDLPGDQTEQNHVVSPVLSVLPKLRILRLSGNRLKYLNVARFPNLRTLYVDNNYLAEGRAAQHAQGQRMPHYRLSGLHRLCKLENFSARNQGAPGVRDSGLQVQSSSIRDVKRLYLSGNPSPVPLGVGAQSCYNLVYLELAACRLTSLPADFSNLMPNIRALNLNYNFLETEEVAIGLAGLKRLRKLTIIGNRMTGTKALIRMLSVMGQNIGMLDFRMNPCTLGWYLPLLVQDKDNGALLQPSEPAKGKPQPPFASALPVPSSHPDGDAEAFEQNNNAVNGAIESGGAEPTGSNSRKKGKQTQTHWETLDAQFRRGLPDKAYAGRLAYRGLIMRACPNIKILDGVRVTEKENRKAEALLVRVLKEAGPNGAMPRAILQ